AGGLGRSARTRPSQPGGAPCTTRRTRADGAHRVIAPALAATATTGDRHVVTGKRGTPVTAHFGVVAHVEVVICRHGRLVAGWRHVESIRLATTGLRKVLRTSGSGV